MGMVEGGLNGRLMNDIQVRRNSCLSAAFSRPSLVGLLLLTLGPVAMSTPSEIAENIRASATFFLSQGTLLPDADKAASMEAMVRSITSQISCLKSLDMVAAAEVNSAISANTMFCSDQKKRLAAALDRRFAQGNISGVASRYRGGVRVTQTMGGVNAYLCESDWAILESRAGLQEKVCVLVDRLSMVGLTNPSEATTKTIAAVLACCHSPQGSPAHLFMLVQEVVFANVDIVRIPCFFGAPIIPIHRVNLANISRPG